MDEMNISLKTKWMKRLVAKLLSKMIKDKTGCDVDIKFDQIGLVTGDGAWLIKANLEAVVKTEDVAKIVESVKLD